MSSNRIWFDTEFLEDGVTIQLISIGAVREDGLTYYAETWPARQLADSTDWLRKNVLPHLTCDAATSKNKAEIARDMVAFAGDRPEFWAYFADYDWVVMCQLFGRMIDLPATWPMYCRDLKQLADERGTALPQFRDANRPVHNALADALECRDRHLWLLAREQR